MKPSPWPVDLHQHMYAFESDLRHIRLQTPFLQTLYDEYSRDVRLSLLVGITKATNEQIKGKPMWFKFGGNEKEGTVISLQLHLSELNPGRNNIRLACSLFLWTNRSEELGNKDVNRASFLPKRYMSCDITTMNGQRSDDIFVFLTEVLPKCVRI